MAIDYTAPSRLQRIEKFMMDNYTLRYNVVSNRVECRRKNATGEFEIVNENTLYRQMHHSGLRAPIAEIRILMQSDFVTYHDPFRCYFESVEVDDDFDHIGHLASYVETSNDAHFALHLRKWFLRAVQCAVEDSYFAKQALILSGESQNTGKSTFIRFLCPPTLSSYIAENISLDKDSQIALSENLIVNIDELYTYGKHDINSLKALFSKERIKVRHPYAAQATTTPRRASFIGSTNRTDFLSDETGSVRFICVVVRSIDWEYSDNVDIDKVWGQAYRLYKNGHRGELTAQEIAKNEANNAQYMESFIELELIQQHLSPASNGDADYFLSATEILHFISERCATGHPTLQKVVKALKIMGCERHSKYCSNKGQSTYGYFLKNRIT